MELLRLLQLRELLRDQENLRDLASFTKLAWPILEPGTELKWNWHLDLLCEYLTLVKDRAVRRLVINVPPQTMKSRLVNVFYPAWSWSQIATRRFLSSSYSGDLSEGFNVERSRLVQSAWFQGLWPDKVRLLKNRQDEIENDVGGRMTATSTGGTATGKGSHDVIIDDPLNPKMAASEVELKAANEFFDHTLRTRLSDQVTGAFVIVMQRLDHNDLTGHVLAMNPGEWTHVRIPMEAEEDERWVFPISGRVVERKAGALLWEERFPRTVMDSLKRDMGSWAYEAQEQQRPSPRGGNIIKRHWLRFWNAATKPKQFDQIIQSWDMAFVKREDSSFVTGQVWGQCGARKLLLDEVHARLDFVETKQALRTLTANHPLAYTKLVEDKANGPAIISDLRATISGLIAESPDGDKTARMFGVSPEFEAGNVELPDPEMPGYGWVREWIEEIVRFPQKPNDRGDACSQALKRLRQSGGLLAYYQQQATAAKSAEAAA